MAERNKIIHCRLTKDEHDAIKDRAAQLGQSITQYVVAAALAQSQAPAPKHP